MTDTYSEITLWRSFRRFAWKPWSADFEDDHFAYAVDGWTRRGVLRKATKLRNQMLLNNGEHHER